MRHYFLMRRKRLTASETHASGPVRDTFSADIVPFGNAGEWRLGPTEGTGGGREKKEVIAPHVRAEKVCRIEADR